MVLETIRQCLLEHPFLEGLRATHVERLASLATEIQFQRDQVIFNVGEESAHFYLILAGKVALDVPSPGRTVRIQVVGEGDELGWSSLLVQTHKQFKAVCLNRTTALMFDGHQLLAACEEDHEFGYFLMRRVLQTVAERLQAARLQLADMYSPAGVRAS